MGHEESDRSGGASDLASRVGSSTSHAEPRPDVHVRLELFPDPPPEGNCCRFVTVNPTNQESSQLTATAFT